MRRRLFVTLVVIALLTLALLGWMMRLVRPLTG